MRGTGGRASILTHNRSSYPHAGWEPCPLSTCPIPLIIQLYVFFHIPRTGRRVVSVDTLAHKCPNRCLQKLDAVLSHTRLEAYPYVVFARIRTSDLAIYSPTSKPLSQSEFCKLKASAHSFKQFTSRLLKLSFSLSMHIYNSDGRHAWFHLHGTSRPDRSASEATKYKMKNSLSTVGLEPCNTKQYIYQTKYAVLCHSRTYNNVYISIGSTCM